ncbi:MAG: tRNA (adenosine(37)-N6)-threonylcarbamoyltransferase complex dimerization subunit type 1 TsaB [Oscillospiraceae bacterium]|nr:tRNA (adenosine(37)-N6)-threonylcarbamoyltransferase complex dimerization subunit type 1 TsaB [Oscillospiraceae bacterium]
MKTLAIESAAKTASVALLEDGVLRAELFQNNGLTHSKTVLPMVDSLLSGLGMTPQEIDRIAVSHGPGSFTGLRIGVAAAKGLALALDIPCVGVSTLEAAAMNAQDGFICVVMDARAGQVYNACFTMEHGTLSRVTEDRALPLSELRELLFSQNRILLLGDGAQLCAAEFQDHSGLILPPLSMRVPRAFGVGMAAEHYPAVDPAELKVEYLRVPQAERERLARMKQKED